MPGLDPGIFYPVTTMRAGDARIKSAHDAGRVTCFSGRISGLSVQARKHEPPAPVTWGAGASGLLLVFLVGVVAVFVV